MRGTPEIVEVDSSKLEDALRRAEQSLDPEDYRLFRAIADSYAYVSDLVEDKNTSIRRLRKLMFGSRSEKTSEVVGPKDQRPATPVEQDALPDASQPVKEPPTEQADSPPAPKGHGRNGADAYAGAERIDVPHPTLTAGDACPKCGQGTVYAKSPGTLMRIIGQPPVSATIYRLEKLRCHLCGQVFTAPAPAEAGDRKYDATAASMIGLLKYGSGLPFNRLAGLQGSMNIPLPASTQWDIVEAVAEESAPAFEELVRQAAQGEVLHNDDTTVKILELMGKRARESALRGEQAEPGRSGLYTSGVVALAGGRRVALFFSGNRHAGENLAQVLRQRAAELPPPIQMCDALARNLPGELRTIVANCLAHARRQFVDVYDRFPDQCQHLLESLAVVYRNDAISREQGLSAEERLQLHQRESGPTMLALHVWLTAQLEEKLVEPNSALGGAIRYMLRHWEKLTLFLRQAGAPLDNNLCERALKKAILHRKNALFYKTPNGARVGDLLMSLIYTCELNQSNPFDYLTELQRHSEQLAQCPLLWMPWNYRDQLESQVGKELGNGQAPA